MTDEETPEEETVSFSGLPVVSDRFASTRLPDGSVIIIHEVATPAGTLRFMRPHDYHLAVMSNGRKSAGAGTIDIAPAGLQIPRNGR